jgi:hypothetical protein
MVCGFVSHDSVVTRLRSVRVPICDYSCGTRTLSGLVQPIAGLIAASGSRVTPYRTVGRVSVFGPRLRSSSELDLSVCPHLLSVSPLRAVRVLVGSKRVILRAATYNLKNTTQLERYAKRLESL